MTSPSAPSLNLLMPSGPSARAPRPEAGGGGDFSAWLNGGDAAAPPSNAVPRAPGGELTEAPRAEAPQLPPRKRTLPPQRAPERTPERALERTRAPSPQTLPPELDKPPPQRPPSPYRRGSLRKPCRSVRHPSRVSRYASHQAGCGAQCQPLDCDTDCRTRSSTPDTTRFGAGNAGFARLGRQRIAGSTPGLAVRQAQGHPGRGMDAPAIA